MGLPPEVLLVVLEYLEFDDVLEFSLASKLCYQLSMPTIYAKVYASWSIVPSFPDFLGRYLRHLVVRADSPEILGGEWRYSGLVSHWIWCRANLHHLSLQCSGSSSGWLKYMDGLPIETLELECCAKGDGVHLFEFDHIGETFSKLKSIKLVNFLLLPPETKMEHLGSIELVNCIWNYPMSLTQISDYKHLSITLDRPLHPFSFSERLQFETHNPPDTLTSLHLHLDIGHTVTWTPLHNGAENLCELSLRGFQPFSRTNRAKFPNLVKLIQ